MWRNSVHFPLGHLKLLGDDPLQFARNELSEKGSTRRATTFWSMHRPVM